jgi:hypothetical protein
MSDIKVKLHDHNHQDVQLKRTAFRLQAPGNCRPLSTLHQPEADLQKSPHGGLKADQQKNHPSSPRVGKLGSDFRPQRICLHADIRHRDALPEHAAHQRP